MIQNKPNSDQNMYSLGLGTQVNIKRTDGRVHSAVVSTINWGARSVTVEWFEKNETKGKEVDLETLVTLNPQVLVTQSPPQQSQQQSSPQQKPQPPMAQQVNQQPPGMLHPTLTANMQPPAVPVTTNVVASNAQIPVRKNEKRGTVQMQAAPSALDTAIKPDDRRRSNVVKEVEKLKKNREERRMRQAEMRNEKENLMAMDPGNPNWEFLQMIREYRTSLDFNPLRDTDPVEDHQITVCVRKRPMNKKEVTRKEVDVVTVANKNTITVHEPKTKVDLTKYLENQQFRFDYAFDEECSNDTVYKYSAAPLVRTIFEGGMATCFAYGQTGSGKTHTMGGEFSSTRTQNAMKGIYAMTARDVFGYLRNPNFRTYSVHCSFFEIYSGKVFDLLNQKTKLRVLEDGKQQVQVVGLTEKNVKDVEDVLKLIAIGNATRTSGVTSANSNSSRSHAVFQIFLKGPNNGTKVHGKFSLIDLAGNERGADTRSADRQTRMEGAEINKSLLSLKECIRALGRRGAHLPFRASKLTQVLRDSFIGEKSRTCMIAMISPGMSSCEHSLNTLRYADRVKELAVKDGGGSGNVTNTANGNNARNGPSDFILAAEMDIVSQTGNGGLGGLKEESIPMELEEELDDEDDEDPMGVLHETISKMQEAEEEMVETHRILLEKEIGWARDLNTLLNETNKVEYDQEAYTLNIDNICVQKINLINELRAKIEKFRETLSIEERVSREIGGQQPPKHVQQHGKSQKNANYGFYR